MSGPDEIKAREIEDNTEEHEDIESYFENRSRRPSGRRTSGGRPSSGRDLLSLLLTFVITVLVVLLVRQYALQHNTVVGTSMLPALEDGDMVLVEKLSRLFEDGLKRGAIVTAEKEHEADSSADGFIIKRIIGLPGEHIQIRDGQVLVDGFVLSEPYLAEGVITEARPGLYADIKLGPDQYYLLGDNRSSSRDSRDTGPYEHSQIEGTLILRFYPFRKIGKPQ